MISERGGFHWTRFCERFSSAETKKKRRGANEPRAPSSSTFPNHSSPSLRLHNPTCMTPLVLCTMFERMNGFFSIYTPDTLWHLECSTLAPSCHWSVRWEVGILMVDTRMRSRSSQVHVWAGRCRIHLAAPNYSKPPFQPYCIKGAYIPLGGERLAVSLVRWSSCRALKDCCKRYRFSSVKSIWNKTGCINEWHREFAKKLTIMYLSISNAVLTFPWATVLQYLFPTSSTPATQVHYRAAKPCWRESEEKTYMILGRRTNKSYQKIGKNRGA